MKGNLNKCLTFSILKISSKLNKLFLVETVIRYECIIFLFFIGIAPKLYGGNTKNDDSEIFKVKGFKEKVEFDTLKSILFNNESKTFNQDKWFKYFLNEEIRIKSQEYTLALNENNRTLDIENLRTLPYQFK